MKCVKIMKMIPAWIWKLCGQQIVKKYEKWKFNNELIKNIISIHVSKKFKVYSENQNKKYYILNLTKSQNEMICNKQAYKTLDDECYAIKIQNKSNDDSFIWTSLVFLVNEKEQRFDITRNMIRDKVFKEKTALEFGPGNEFLFFVDKKVKIKQLNLINSNFGSCVAVLEKNKDIEYYAKLVVKEN